MKRTDPAAGPALLIFNFSGDAHSIPVATSSQSWRLELWTGDAIYGGTGDARPAETVVPGSESHINLFGFEAAIYLG